ncbi:uncharacterized protein LOC34620213 [Cyclospora cayetanensis]|uniref:Uncharacterized protein LOC34620213 n=1 Tax=Cyclospora cayetanensis TaxID=88456 RepID=A0A6P6RU13_9EIME|nr:uncharacterized protein LOC34620213 [Cyclospora cayetanensis]
MELDYAAADEALPTDASSAGGLIEGTNSPSATSPAPPPAHDDLCYVASAAAVTTSAQQHKQQPRHDSCPLRLHAPRPRLGHTITPFNLPMPTAAPQTLPQAEISPLRQHQQPPPHSATFRSSSHTAGNAGGTRNKDDSLWMRSLVRPVMVGGCCASAAAAATQAANPDEPLHRIVEKVTKAPKDAFLGFTAAEAAASLRQTPLPLLQQAVSAAAAAAAATSGSGAQRVAGTTLEKDWLEAYLARLASAGSRNWLWWRLPFASTPCSVDSTGAAAAADTPEHRIHHAAAPVSAERQCAAVAVFGGRKADGTLANDELYLLEVTQLLSLHVPVCILGELLFLALSTAAAEARAEATIGSGECKATEAPAAAITVPLDAQEGDVGEPGCKENSSCVSSSTITPPLLRWRMPPCVGKRPSPRMGHSLVYADPHLILHGGKDERGQLLSDVWVLDIFDWKCGSQSAAPEGNTAAMVAKGTTNTAAAVQRKPAVALCWVALDFSACSPLRPPGRFLHSCSVFVKTTNDGSCCIVIAGGWTSVVLPRARHYALQRDAEGHWRHSLLPVRVANAADQRFMHASVCAGSTLLLSGGLRVRSSMPPLAVSSPIVSHDALTHRSACFPHVPMPALVGHQAWQVGGRIFCFGGLKVNDDCGPLNPVSACDVVSFDACKLLPTSSAEHLMADRHRMHLQLQRRAAALNKRPLPDGTSEEDAESDHSNCWNTDGSSSGSSKSNSNSPKMCASTSQTTSAGGCLSEAGTAAGPAAAAAASDPPAARSLDTSYVRRPEGGEVFTSWGSSKKPCSKPWSYADGRLLSDASHTSIATAPAPAQTDVVATRALQEVQSAVVTPRRNRRLAALQAIESFKLLPAAPVASVAGPVAAGRSGAFHPAAAGPAAEATGAPHGGSYPA